VSAPAGRRPGNDPRIVTFRGALEALLESLDATVRVARWQQESGGQEGGGAVPEPLKKSASQLLERLGSATRLASGRFVGTTAIVATSEAIRTAINELDGAYVAYRKQMDSSPTAKDEAALALDSELGRVKMQARHWE
jgi:hypothetical protein